MTAVDRLRRWSAATMAGVMGFSTACVHIAPKGAVDGTFFDPNGHVLTSDQASMRLRAAQFVLVGEAHDNVCDHRQEALLTAMMAVDGRPFAVGLEMVTLNRQSVLDLFSLGKLDLPALEAALEWKKSWGYSFAWYSPVFEVAQKAGAPVVGLNAPDTLVHAIRDNGMKSLSPEQRLDLPPELLPPGREQEAMLRSAFDAHARSGKGSPPKNEAWSKFMRVQSVWDTVMAWRAAKASEALHRRVLIVAGGGHVEHGWGIARRLRVYAPGANVLSVMPWHGDDFDPSEADLFFVCPPTPEKTMPEKTTPQSAAPPSDSVMLPACRKPPSTASPPTP